jgi:glutamate--cysteine ligase
LRDPDRLPSARVLRAMRSEYEGSYTGFVNACSERTRQHLMQRPLAAKTQARLTRLAQESLREQQRIEAADNIGFEEYRQHYLSPQRLVV